MKEQESHPATHRAALIVTDASPERRCGPEKVPVCTPPGFKVPPPSDLKASYILCVATLGHGYNL